MTQTMHQRHIRENIDPFKLFTNLSHTDKKNIDKALKQINKSSNTSNKPPPSYPTSSTIHVSSSSITSASASSTSLSSSQHKSNTLDSNFASRYEDEIASTTKLKEYKALGTKHKDILMKEAHTLQTKYNEDIVLAKQIESTVTNISTCLNEFTNILRGQTGLVDELYETALDATDFVNQADKELQLTIKRSTSHSRNISFLAVGLAVLLLLLDFLTP